MNDEMQDLRRRIRAWTARPPAIPPPAARTRVLARLEGRRLRPTFRLAAAAAALAAVAVCSLVLQTEKPTAPPAEAPSRGLLVYELESGTKVYLELAARTNEGRRR